MEYSQEQRDQIIASVLGNTVQDLYYEKEGGYWVMVFSNGTETCFRFMAELC